jgi:hypothetical protein
VVGGGSAIGTPAGRQRNTGTGLGLGDLSSTWWAEESSPPGRMVAGQGAALVAEKEHVQLPEPR